MNTNDRAVDSYGRCRIEDNACRSSRPWHVYTVPAPAAGFDGLRLKLKAATPAELDRLAQHWAGLPGRIADTARHLIDEEFEVRQAAARLEHITGSTR